jgi:aminopeptidase
MDNSSLSFPPFSLSRLMSTCFGHGEGEGDRLCILIDIPELSMMHGHAFLSDDGCTVQKYAYETFHKGFTGELLAELKYRQNDFFAFKTTGGSNLDPDDDVTDANGSELSLERDVYPHYDLILAITDYSLTAPLTAMAKKYGFRGATLHGVNPIILESGLSVDYREVSVQAELFRSALTSADAFELDFEALGETTTLRIECGGQEAQKSHGLCPRGNPDVANLPAGEVYFVPTGASGAFPFRFPDGTLARLQVRDGAICEAKLLSGDPELVAARNIKLKEDPATGILGELGFGTQILPFSGRDIQDEKILGTCHVATGRSDHLGGSLTPDLFASRKNASHDDILYAPPKTPEINVPEVRMYRNGESQVVLAEYQPSDYLKNAIGLNGR